MANIFIEQLKQYQGSTLRGDLIAGLTVAVMLIPQGMAYALLAGLPPIYGLYAALVPMLIYPLFGSSRHLSVGPVALVSLIVLSGISEFAEPMSGEFIQLAILTSLVAGAIQVILAALRMGFLVNFLSHPVISGFTSAAAVIIALSQFKYVLGINVGRSPNIIETVKALFLNLNSANSIAILIGGLAIAFILLSKYISKKIPSALIVVLLGVGAVILFSWEETVAIVKEVPGGLPEFSAPMVTWENIKLVLPIALVICLISFIESLAIAKTLSAKNGNYPINANKELLGLGLAKIVGSFFQAFPNTGSFTRSAINEQSGAMTGVASIFAAGFVALTLLFFTPAFYYLPQAVLAAIVISAVFGLIDVKGAIQLFNQDKKDFVVMLTTFILTLILGVQQGVFVGIAISLIFILYKVARPHYAVLGNLPDSNIYRNVNRFDDAITESEYLIFRYDDDIFFGNAEHFYDVVLEEIKSQPEMSTFILDASSISSIDSTGVHQLILLKSALNNKNIRFFITGLKGPVRDLFPKYGLDKVFPAHDLFMNISSALESPNFMKSKSSSIRTKLPVL